MNRRVSHPWIEAFIEYLRAERGYSEHTVQAYTRDLRRLTVYLKTIGRGLEDVDDPDLVGFSSWLANRGLQNSSIMRTLASVRSFFRFLQRVEFRADNPARFLQMPRRAWRLPDVLSEEEVRRLLAVIPPDTPIGLRDRAIVSLLYATGMRVSELTALRLDDLDLTEARLVCRGKGGRVRRLPFDPETRTDLEAYLSRGRPQWCQSSSARHLFVNRWGRPLSRTTVWRRLRLWARKAGLKGQVYPHRIRHSFATHLLHRGADLRVVQILLGHARITTTEIYTHIEPRRFQQAIRRHPLVRWLTRKSPADDTPPPLVEGPAYTPPAED